MTPEITNPIDICEAAFSTVRQFVDDLRGEMEIYRRMLELILRSPDEDAKLIALLGLGRVVVTMDPPQHGGSR